MVRLFDLCQEFSAGLEGVSAKFVLDRLGVYPVELDWLGNHSYDDEAKSVLSNFFKYADQRPRQEVVFTDSNYVGQGFIYSEDSELTFKPDGDDDDEGEGDNDA